MSAAGRERRRIARMMRDCPIYRVPPCAYHNPTVARRMGPTPPGWYEPVKRLAIGLWAAVIVAALIGIAARALGEETQTRTMYVCVSEGSCLYGRAEPDKGSDIEAKFYAGYDVDVLKVENGWAYVQGCEAGTVWCSVGYLSDDPPGTEAKRYTVTANGRVRVRATPEGATVRWLKDGETVTVTRRVDGWAYIGDGYVLEKYMEEMDDGLLHQENHR